MSNEILQDLCNGEGNILREKLTALVQAEADRVDLPYLKEATLKHLPGILTEANKILADLKKSFYNQGYLVYDRFFTWDGQVILDEQPIIAKHTIYVDNEAKEKVKAMADKLISAIRAFNNYVQSVSDGRVKGFGSSSTYRQPLITVHTDGKDPEIDGKLFKHIHMT